MPFREAHEVVGKLVAKLEAEGRTLQQLSAEELAEASPAFGPDAVDAVDIEKVVARRTTAGGTSAERVRQQLDSARQVLEADERAFEQAAGV
jgi:argininosuccinate lyase